MMSHRQKAGWFVAVVMLMMVLYGCGETVRGVAKDTSRVGRGVKTIFISD